MPTLQHRILIVDDEAIIGLCLASELEELGHQVAGPFVTGAEALQQLKTDIPDVAIVDVSPQDSSGLELARGLRQKGVPFVFFSADDRSASRVLVEFDKAPWVEKPALLPEILDAIDQAYDRQGVEATAA